MTTTHSGIDARAQPRALVDALLILEAHLESFYYRVGENPRYANELDATNVEAVFASIEESIVLLDGRTKLLRPILKWRDKDKFPVNDVVRILLTGSYSERTPKVSAFVAALIDHHDDVLNKIVDRSILYREAMQYNDVSLFDVLSKELIILDWEMSDILKKTIENDDMYELAKRQAQRRNYGKDVFSAAFGRALKNRIVHRLNEFTEPYSDYSTFEYEQYKCGDDLFNLDSLLECAIYGNLPKYIKLLWEDDYELSRGLLIAIATKNINLAKYFVEKIDTLNNSGGFLLTCALREFPADFIERMMAKGFNNIRERIDHNAYYIAGSMNAVDKLRAILKYRVLFSPLKHALIELLKDANTSIDIYKVMLPAFTVSDTSYIMREAIDRNRVDVIHLMIDIEFPMDDTISKSVFGEFGSHTEYYYRNAFVYALYMEKFDIGEIMLRKYAPIIADDGTYLRSAISTGPVKVVDFLLLHGAKVPDDFDTIIFFRNTAAVVTSLVVKKSDAILIDESVTCRPSAMPDDITLVSIDDAVVQVCRFVETDDVDAYVRVCERYELNDEWIEHTGVLAIMKGSTKIVRRVAEKLTTIADAQRRLAETAIRLDQLDSVVTLLEAGVKPQLLADAIAATPNASESAKWLVERKMPRLALKNEAKFEFQKKLFDRVDEVANIKKEFVQINREVGDILSASTQFIVFKPALNDELGDTFVLLGKPVGTTPQNWTAVAVTLISLKEVRKYRQAVGDVWKKRDDELKRVRASEENARTKLADDEKYLNELKEQKKKGKIAKKDEFDFNEAVDVLERDIANGRRYLEKVDKDIVEIVQRYKTSINYSLVQMTRGNEENVFAVTITNPKTSTIGKYSLRAAKIVQALNGFVITIDKDGLTAKSGGVETMHSDLKQGHRTRTKYSKGLDIDKVSALIGKTFPLDKRNDATKAAVAYTKALVKFHEKFSIGSNVVVEIINNQAELLKELYGVDPRDKEYAGGDARTRTSTYVENAAKAQKGPFPNESVFKSVAFAFVIFFFLLSERVLLGKITEESYYEYEFYTQWANNYLLDVVAQMPSNPAKWKPDKTLDETKPSVEPMRSGIRLEDIESEQNTFVNVLVGIERKLHDYNIYTVDAAVVQRVQRWIEDDHQWNLVLAEFNMNAVLDKLLEGSVQLPRVEKILVALARAHNAPVAVDRSLIERAERLHRLDIVDYLLTDGGAPVDWIAPSTLAELKQRRSEQPAMPSVHVPMTYAHASLPRFLEIRYIDEVFGYGVFARRAIRANFVLGRYTGAVTLQRPMGFNQYVIETEVEGGLRYYIDASSVQFNDAVEPVQVRFGDNPLIIDAAAQQTNWTRYVNSVDVDMDAAAAKNVDFVEDASTGGVLLVTTRRIEANEQLLADYGNEYFFVDPARLRVTNVPLGDDRLKILRKLKVDADKHASELEAYASDLHFTEVFVVNDEYAPDQFDPLAYVVLHERPRERQVDVVDYHTTPLKNVHVIRDVLAWVIDDWARLRGARFVQSSVFEDDRTAQQFKFERVQAIAFELNLDEPVRYTYMRLLAAPTYHLISISTYYSLEEELADRVAPIIRENFINVIEFQVGRKSMQKLRLYRISENDRAVGHLITGRSGELQVLRILDSASQFRQRYFNLYRWAIKYYVENLRRRRDQIFIYEADPTMQDILTGIGFVDATLHKLTNPPVIANSRIFTWDTVVRLTLPPPSPQRP